MKTSCKIIEDLLPMYHDGICSEDSAALIEEHMRSAPVAAKSWNPCVVKLSSKQPIRQTI